jgi:hypothetical protein
MQLCGACGVRCAVVSFSSLVALMSCRVEPRVLDVSKREEQSARFRFDPSEEGFQGPAVRWSTAQQTQVGQSSLPITPARPGSLAGYGGFDRRLFPPRLYPGSEPTVFCRPYEETESEPRVKATVLSGNLSGQEPPSDEGRRLYVLLSFDLVAVTQDVTQALLDETNGLMVELGLSPLGQASFQVSATHTHSGPAGLALSPLWSAFACDSYQPSYRRLVLAAARQAIAQAVKDLRPVQPVTVYRATIDGWNNSRFAGMEVDRSAFGVLAVDGAKQVAGCLFSYPVHSTFYGPDSLRLSRDIAGWLEDEFSAGLSRLASARDAALPQGPSCSFVNGASGNATARLDGRTKEAYASGLVNEILTRVEPSVAGALAEAGSSTAGSEGVSDAATAITAATAISYAAVAYPLPKPNINFSACGAALAEPFLSLPILDVLPSETKLSALRLGDDVLIFVPAELVFEAAQVLRGDAQEVLGQNARIHFVTTANDYSGYVVPSSRMGAKEIESCSSLFGGGHLEALRQALKRLLVSWQDGP